MDWEGHRQQILGASRAVEDRIGQEGLPSEISSHKGQQFIPFAPFKLWPLGWELYSLRFQLVVMKLSMFIGRTSE